MGNMAILWYNYGMKEIYRVTAKPSKLKAYKEILNMGRVKQTEDFEKHMDSVIARQNMYIEDRIKAEKNADYAKIAAFIAVIALTSGSLLYTNSNEILTFFRGIN